MKPNAHVVYRDLDASPALNSIINKKLEKLQRFSNSIIHSRVVLDSPHNQKHKGKLYRATVEIGVKGKPLLVSQDDASVHIAVKNAFAAAERKLKQATNKRHSTRH